MPFQIDDTGKIKVHNIYFPYSEETNEAMLLLIPRPERLVVPKSRGCCLATLSDLLGALFARQEVLQAWEPACSPIEKRVTRPKFQGSRLLFSSIVAKPTPKELLE